MADASRRATAARFKRVGAYLALVVAAARPRLEALAITLRETSNPSGWDWVQTSPYLSWDFVRTNSHSSYTVMTTASVRLTSAVEVDGPDVLALLRRAAPAFPELLENEGWPGFPDLPSMQGEVDHLVQIRAFHKEMVEPWSGPRVGCSEAEILALEVRLGWPLPLAYKQYLTFMGADRKGVFVGCDWFIEAARINTIDSELAYMGVDYTPRGDTLTFMSHQGYMFGWLDLPFLSDDPPVYFYTESAKDNAIEHHIRFTDLLLAELEHMSYFLRKLGK